MIIKIMKKDDGTIIYNFEGNDYEFDYSSFDKLIDSTYFNDVKINFEYDEELNEYKELLDGIILNSRTTEYRLAVKKAVDSKKALEQKETEH